MAPFLLSDSIYKLHNNVRCAVHIRLAGKCILSEIFAEGRQAPLQDRRPEPDPREAQLRIQPQGPFVHCGVQEKPKHRALVQRQTWIEFIKHCLKATAAKNRHFTSPSRCMQHTSSTAYEAPQIGQRDVLIFATTIDNYHRFSYIMRISLTSGKNYPSIRIPRVRCVFQTARTY